ncbi:MAG TPA: SDR family NAD(P)-dependent oxidoreductase [Nitrosopumilaceae archaeon]|nr:SDR family NAD(P)-dependent oxidoreductase [Nitrosopumilaceae archaeon]
MDNTLSNKCKGKTIFVTGGAGFIGSEVIRQISSFGANAIVFDNLSSGKRHYLSNLKNVKFIKGDIRNRGVISRALRNCDYIINLAALPFIPDSYHYPQEFFDVNTNGTLNVVLEAIKQKSIKNFVHVSTSEVYGSAKKNPMDENHPTLPQSTYAVSKLAADRAVFTIHKEHDYPAVIIRPFNSYGPRITQPYIIPEIINQILHRKDTVKLGNVESYRDFTYVADTARGMISALFNENAVGETINIGSGETYKIKDLVEIIAGIIGKKIHITIDKKRFRPFDVQKLICDNRKAKKVLAWEPEISIKDGLTRTVNWMRQNPPDFATPFEGWAKTYRMNLNRKK